MLEEIYKKKTEAAEIVSYIRKILSTKKVSRQTGIMTLEKFAKPETLSRALFESIDDFLDLMDELALILDEEELKFFKSQSAKIIQKISVTVHTVNKNKNFSPIDVENYNNFRKAQKNVQLHFLKALQGEKHIKYKGKKYVWLGKQRELIDLFDKLFEKGWIQREPNLSKEVQALPILEMFDIIKKDQPTAINEPSFNKEWKGYSIYGDNIKNSLSYKSIFNTLPVNTKTSKK